MLYILLIKRAISLILFYASNCLLVTAAPEAATAEGNHFRPAKPAASRTTVRRRMRAPDPPTQLGLSALLGWCSKRPPAAFRSELYATGSVIAGALYVGGLTAIA